MCTKKQQLYRVQFLRYWVREIFCHFELFLPFFPPNNSEDQNFEKMKKAPRDLIILNLCNKKHDNMMYAYSDMECDRHNFLLF